MKQIFLALILIAVPVAIFTSIEMYLVPHAVPMVNLGDLTELKTIVTDTQTIAKSGDLVAAEKRITDFETAWDEGEARLRPLNAEAWGVIDSAADKAIRALRARAPDVAKVTETLSGLNAAIDNPVVVAGSAVTELKVAGIAVTDSNGHPLPCETMLTPLREAIKTGKILSENLAAANDFMTKATERCNADDDTHADEFSAQGLALAAQ